MSFMNTHMPRATFREAHLRGANFMNATLTDADFTGADIRGANFMNAKLCGAVFTDARYDDSTRWPAGFLPADAQPCPLEPSIARPRRPEPPITGAQALASLKVAERHTATAEREALHAKHHARSAWLVAEHAEHVAWRATLVACIAAALAVVALILWMLA